MHFCRVKTGLLRAGYLGPCSAVGREIALVEAEAGTTVLSFVQNAEVVPSSRLLAYCRAVVGIGRVDVKETYAASAEAFLQFAAKRFGDDVRFYKGVAEVGYAHRTSQFVDVAERFIKWGHTALAFVGKVLNADHAFGAGVLKGRFHFGGVGQRTVCIVVFGEHVFGEHVGKESHTFHLVISNLQRRNPLKRKEHAHHDEKQHYNLEWRLFHKSSCKIAWSVVDVARCFNGIAHLKEKVNLSAVCGILPVQTGYVHIVLHGVSEVGHMCGFVHVERLGQLVLVCFKPCNYFVYFFLAV